MAAAALALSLALLALLSALMVYPAASAGERRYAPSDGRASVFAEISGALLDRYANEGEHAVFARGPDGGTTPASSASTEAAPLSLPFPTDSLLVSAAPPIPVSPDARTFVQGGEEETWIAPGAANRSTGAVLPDGRTSAPGLRLFVHFSTLAPGGRERATAVAEALEEQGYVVADVRDVTFPIASPKVRYFFPADRTGAERLAREAMAVLMSEDEHRRAVPVQDYTHFRPLPTPGNVEIWLPSRQVPGDG